ncbi:MAG: N-6 DNA methylase [Candidatus Omnitrophota bacterium]
MREERREELRKQKDIGQFFTPRVVVEFIYDMIKIHLDKEEKWVKGKSPSVIDPACGEGVFLKIALDKKNTKPRYVFGIDIDEKVKEKWVSINLLKAFGSRAKLDIHFYHQNGLLPLPKKTLRYKKGGLAEYDLVVGNPPYGGVGLQEITPELHDALLKYEIWRRAMNQNGKTKEPNLFSETPEVLGKKRKERLKKFPIEILFVERFIQLVKPGGHIAIIVPDGILSNSNQHYVREFIAERVKIDAIVSLPRETFKNVGTSAKTSILFMTKSKEDEKISSDYKVFLAAVEKSENLTEIYKYYKEVNQMNPVKKDLVKVINDSGGNEIAMVRVDKTLKEMMQELPAGRLDPQYWDIHLQNLLSQIHTRHKLNLLGDFIEFITYGQVGKRIYNKNGDIRYIQTINLTNSGVDYYIKEAFIDAGSHNDPKRSRLKYEDVLLGNAGMGGLGKCVIFLSKNEKVNISQDIDILRLKNINPCYVCIFIKSNFGNAQIWIRSKGVGAPKLPFDEIKAIKIPILADIVQKNIESGYKKVSIYHDKAMETKTKGNEQDYKKNIETAEKMLKDLIVRTEAVIRGERKDVV